MAPESDLLLKLGVFIVCDVIGIVGGHYVDKLIHFDEQWKRFLTVEPGVPDRHRQLNHILTMFVGGLFGGVGGLTIYSIVS